MIPKWTQKELFPFASDDWSSLDMKLILPFELKVNSLVLFYFGIHFFLRWEMPPAKSFKMKVKKESPENTHRGNNDAHTLDRTWRDP